MTWYLFTSFGARLLVQAASDDEAREKLTRLVLVPEDWHMEEY